MSTDEKQKPIIILSGPMSGLPDHNYRAFNLAADQFREYGYEVVNPAEHSHPIGSTWGEMVGTCLETMRILHDSGRDCSLAYLQGWERSDGASIENALACHYGWRRVYVTDLLRQAQFEKERERKRNG